MHRRYLLIFLTLFCMAIAIQDDGNKSQTSTEYQQNKLDGDDVANDVNEFGYKLLSKLIKKNNDTNLVISPTGIAGLLAITLLGTVGQTYSELASALGFSQDILSNRAKHEELGALLRHLQPDVGSAGTVYANAVVADTKTPLRHIYREYLARVYHGDAFSTNFGDNERAKHIINEWVKNNTNGGIDDFLKEKLPRDTKLVLLSALNFIGQWTQPFLAGYTKNNSFKTPTRNVTVAQMLNIGDFNYIISPVDGLQMVALPYNDSETTMYVLQPLRHRHLTLPELMAQLNYTRINQLITQMRKQNTLIKFPRMEIKSKLKLEYILQDMGLKSMFKPGDANFGLMIQSNNEVGPTEEELVTRLGYVDREQEINNAVNGLLNPGVYVDQVLHDVKININEQGTIASAATAAFAARSAQMFHVDRPFHIFIRNERTKLVTFSAHIFDPTA